jgi:hypothetical protein
MNMSHTFSSSGADARSKLWPLRRFLWFSLSANNSRTPQLKYTNYISKDAQNSALQTVKDQNKNGQGVLELFTKNDKVDLPHTSETGGSRWGVGALFFYFELEYLWNGSTDLSDSFSILTYSLLLILSIISTLIIEFISCSLRGESFAINVVPPERLN